MELTGDDRPDLAVANGTGNDVILLLNDGSGTFTASSTLTGFEFPTAIKSTDLNGDGFPDLVVADNTKLHRLLGSASGFMPLAPVPFSESSSSRCLAVADVDGDGFVDILQGNGSFDSGRLEVYFGDGTGDLSPPLILDNGRMSAVSQIKIVDVNSDGTLDVVTAGGFTNSISLYVNGGARTFTRLSDLLCGNSSATPFGIAVSDLNGDSRPDVVSADGNLQRLSFLLPLVGSSLCLDDLNGDGLATRAPASRQEQQHEKNFR